MTEEAKVGLTECREAADFYCGDDGAPWLLLLEEEEAEEEDDDDVDEGGDDDDDEDDSAGDWVGALESERGFLGGAGSDDGDGAPAPADVGIGVGDDGGRAFSFRSSRRLRRCSRDHTRSRNCRATRLMHLHASGSGHDTRRSGSHARGGQRRGFR